MTGGTTAVATVAALRHLDIGALEAAAQRWQACARRLECGQETVVAQVIGPLSRTGWAGRAAGAAIGEIGWLDDRLQHAARTAHLIAQTLRVAAGRWRIIRDRLQYLWETTTRHGLLLDDNGIHLPPSDPVLHDHEEYQAQRRQLAAAAGQLRQRVAELLAAADNLDRYVAAVLARLQPFAPGAGGDTAMELRTLVGDARAVAELTGYTAADLPRQGDPRTAAQRWAAIPQADRNLLLLAYPQHLGGIDGLPATDRDTANRAHLDSCLMSGNNTDATYRVRDLLETADHQRPGEYLLLGFDDRLDGQAVVAIGNPDHAAHTAVVVPGINTDLADMHGQLRRANDIHDTAQRMASADAPVSVVAWLGYNTPEDNSSMIGWARAQAGGQALDSFVDGLHVAHTGEPSHVTVIGHSYGSTVVGEAARHGDGLAVGDIIVAGSPGMHVDSAHRLNLDPGHVWAGHAEDDPVSGWLGGAAGVHANEPSDQNFGANRFHVDTSGHSGYWRLDSISLRNQAAIIVGDYELVTLDHRARP